MFREISILLIHYSGKRIHSWLVQSLNSPFFPPLIGAEPGRAKEESRITCMRMLRTPPFSPTNRGKKPYLEVLSRFRLWRDFLNCRPVKNMSVNRKSVEFQQLHAKLHSTCFLPQHQDNERKLCQDLLPIKNIDSDLKVHVLHYVNEPLVRVRLFFQKLMQQYEKYVWEKSNVAHSLSIRVQTTINHTPTLPFLCCYFFSQYERQRRFFSERELKKTLRDSLTRAAWLELSNFLLIRSEHGHASDPGLFFRPPVFSPYEGPERKESSGTGLIPGMQRIKV